MATASIVRATVIGDIRETIADVTFSNSYTTGGEAIAPNTFGLTFVEYVSPQTVPAGAHIGKTGTYNSATGKFAALTAANVEVANAVDLSAMTVRVVVHGK